MLKNKEAEDIIIGTILKYGDEAFYKTEVLSESDFFYPENQLVYSAISKFFNDTKSTKVNVSEILSILNTIKKNVGDKISEHLTTLNSKSFSIETLSTFVQVVAKLSLTRNLKERLEAGAEDLEDITGEEKITEIITKAEQPIIDFNHNLLSTSEISNLGQSTLDYIDYLIKEQPTILGIPSGFPKFDMAIGGGLRIGVHLIGGRAKAGKSFQAINFANNIAQFDLPVLYLDTELTEETVMSRWIAMLSGCEINEVETGLFAKDPEASKRVQEAKKIIQGKKFFYHNISGRHYTEWLSVMRRWISKEVGLGQDCVIIVDYLKMMRLQDAGNFAEHQYLGQMITDLHNFCLEYKVPMIAYTQLNREGMHRDDQDVIAGSDRLMALCSSFSILRKKTDQDFASDPMENGDRKLVVVDCRYGAGLLDGEYINLITDLSCGKIQEGNTNIENRSAARSPGNLLDDNDEDDGGIDF